MKVTVDIDPANMGTVFGSVKKALCNGLEQPQAKNSIDPRNARNIQRATKMLAALEALYSAKNSIEFYHYFGNFIETMSSVSNANSLVTVFGTNPVSEYFQVIAESQYSSIIEAAFSNIATLAYNCAEGIHRTKKHANEFRETHSRKEYISEDSHKSEDTEEEPTTINELLIHLLREEFKDDPEVKIYLKTKGEV